MHSVVTPDLLSWKGRTRPHSTAERIGTKPQLHNYSQSLEISAQEDAPALWVSKAQWLLIWLGSEAGSKFPHRFGSSLIAPNLETASWANETMKQKGLESHPGMSQLLYALADGR